MRAGKIYILPTRFGVLYLVSIISILLAGAIYNNNLVNLLGFFLLAIALVSMVQTHNNLKNIYLQAVATDPGFADGHVSMSVALENSGRDPRFNLMVRPPKKYSLTYENEDLAPLQGRGLLKKRSSYAINKRGRHTINRVRVSTVYPVGLFESWIYLDTDASFVVYPVRKGTPILPSTFLHGQEGANLAPSRGGDDFRGHRAYIHGDPGSRIDWKAFARGRPLLVKEFDDGNPHAVILNWDETPGSDIEAKLSQLALWIERAHSSRLRYGIKLPGLEIPPNEGVKHYDRCMTELALYPKPNAEEKSKGGADAHAG